MTRKLAVYAVVLGTTLAAMGGAVVARYRTSATFGSRAVASPGAVGSVEEHAGRAIEAPGEVSLALRSLDGSGRLAVDPATPRDARLPAAAPARVCGASAAETAAASPP